MLREYSPQEIEYIEQTLACLVTELKAKNCLSQDFQFSTKAERTQAVEDFIDDFIRTEDPLDRQQSLSPRP